MSKLNSRSDAVGYKRPPAHGRFVKGKSGNPKGRPKAAKGGNTLATLISKPVTVTLDGAPRQVPLAEALTLSIFQRALAGNVPAAREAMKIVEKVAAEQKEEEEGNPPPVLFELVPLRPAQDCYAALEKFGVIEQVENNWCIQSWVIEAALARNSQPVLDDNDRQHIEENMLSPGILDAIWPKAA